MRQFLGQSRRRGAVTVEAAIVYPVTFLLLLGLIVGGLGVFRYQEVSHLAHEGARFAAVRGGQYANENGQDPASQADVRDFVAGRSTALDTAQGALNVEVFLNVTTLDGSGNTVVTTVPWDSSNKAPYSLVSQNGQVRQNTVSVRVTYAWLPEVYLVGPILLSSNATIPMQY